MTKIKKSKSSFWPDLGPNCQQTILYMQQRYKMSVTNFTSILMVTMFLINLTQKKIKISFFKTMSIINSFLFSI